MNNPDIWRKPIYLPYLQPELTDEMVSNVEEKLGYKLPAAYIAILKEQNGGYIRYTLPDYDFALHGIICGIGPYYPNIIDERAPLKDSDDFVSFETDGLLPFDGDGHWYICMDYRENKTEPAVTYIDLELDIQKKVADNFADYLSQLGYYHYEAYGDDDFGYAIETDLSIQEMTAIVGKALGVEFEPLEDDIEFATYRSTDGPPFIFFSPNKVRYGKVEPNDERYEELKPLTNGTALSYPQLPESAILFSCYDESEEQRIIRALSPGFTVKHLREYIPIVLIPEKESEV